MGALVDFHCHLDLFPDFEALVAECEANRVYTLAVTTTPRAWARNRDLCTETKHVRAALGLHPQLVDEGPGELDRWLRLVPESRYVGEVGLDCGPRHYRTIARQKAIFAAVLQACSAEGGKVLSVHSVRAATPVLDLVEEHLRPTGCTVVLHWFSGSVREARRAVELGCMFSINARMLDTDRGRALVRGLPAERLLTETDGPFTDGTAGPMRPREVKRTARQLAAVLDRDEAFVDLLLLRNLRKVVGDGVGP